MKKLFAVLMGLLLAPCGALTCQAEQSPSAASDTLVAYFSCTGNTEAIARQLAQALSADVYAIVPEVPYTPEDLNYNDGNSRANREMSDPSARPKIAGEGIPDMQSYRTIYLGYPIWWGDAPRIVNTFLESYDFSGKTIVPFCTSGGSGIGRSAAHLAALTDESVTWLDGARFPADASAAKIAAFLEESGSLPDADKTT